MKSDEPHRERSILRSRRKDRTLKASPADFQAAINSLPTQIE
jgi:hypothetical protein